jgi:hypothetical protein
MPDITIRSDSVNVEQIMEQIRARIREKRGVDYTEDQLRELAAVKLEKFLDPRGVRSDLLDQFRRTQVAQAPPPPPNYAFEENTLFETHRAPVRFIRRLLQPVLKLMFNPGPLIQALNIQSQLNTINAERETARRGLDQLHFEMLHNLVLETTRLGIEVKNLKMRVESLTSRLEFNERRARSLESVVVYRTPADTPRADAPAPRPARAAEPDSEPLTQVTAPPAPAVVPGEGPGQRSRRRRRRRGRRGAGSVAAIMGGAAAAPAAAPSIPEAPELEEAEVEEAGTSEGEDVEAAPDLSDLVDSSTSSGFREEPQPPVRAPFAHPADAPVSSASSEHVTDSGPGPSSDPSSDSGPGEQ